MSIMPTLAELRDEIDRLFDISPVRSILVMNSNTRERAYEAYIAGLCSEAVRRAGGRATIRGINTGHNPSLIILRGALGHMASDVQDFCYIECDLNGKEFEIHLDVEFEGNSKATHEIDVSFYDKSSADRVRNTRGLPKTNIKLLMAFECKFYTSSLPSTNLGRSFFGLISDCSSSIKLCGFVSNSASDNLKKYFSNKKIEPFTDVTPLNHDSEERFIRFVEQRLRKWDV